MASYTNVVRSKHATLSANTADTVTFVGHCSAVLIQNRSSSGYIFIRADGTAPTVAGADSWAVGPGQSAVLDTPAVGATAVGVISASANDYSISVSRR